MITQDEALAELRNLNRQLGLPEDDGIPTPMSQADAMAQLAQLYEELATLPMTFEEFAEKEQRDQARPLTEKAIAFGSNLVEGAKDLARQGGEALEETPWWMFNPIGQGFAYETMGDIINVGARDFTRFAKTLGAAVMDDPDKAALFGPAIYGASKLIPEEGKLEKAYKRYRENFDYNVKVRPAMLESGEIEYPKLVSFSANFVDPFMALPALKGGAQAVKLGMKSGQKGIAKSMLDAVETAGNIGAYPSAMALRKGMKGTAYATGLGLKGVSQAGKLTEKVAGAPRRIASKVAEKIVPGGRGAVIGGQVVGAITGAIPMAAELGIAEGLGLIAKKAGMEMGEILTTLGQPASQKRFLYRLSTNQAVSPTTRKIANYAYAMNGTAGGDALFNMVANGISAGAINAALAGLSGLSAEEAGMAGGAGFVAGGVIPVGQAGFKAGKSNVARDALSIDRHIKNKLTEDQRTSFKKLPEAAQLMLATLQESGIGAPKFMVMEPNAYLEMLNAERVEKGETPLDRAPAGHYEKQDRTIYVNSANLSKSAKVATEIAAHEVGHDFVYQSLGNDPAMLRLLLEKYEATPEDGTPFYFEYDADNNPVGDPVYLNDEAVTIASDYDRKQKGIAVGRDASKLAQEIGADQFAMMFSQDPNAFENFHPRLRRTLIDASRKLLSVLGVTEPMTGNPLSNPISKAQLNNPAIKRIFRNYGKARATELDLKGDLSEQSVLIEPKKGQTGEDRYVELFGGQGLSLRDAKNLVISNKGLVKEILAIKQRVKEEPKDTWYISKTGRLVGKDLNSPTGQEIYKLFTRNDPFGNVRNLLDAAQESVSQRLGVRFGYRSGTKGKYQNPFKIRDYALYGFEVSPLSNRNSRPTLKVLGYDQAIVRHNIQVLAENKFIKNINDFMRDFEEQGQRALEDPEGRINPEGRKENELMTAAFGLKESAPQIANPRLRKLLESKSLKKSFRGPDIEGMAGLTKGRDKAFSFNYENIRDNYNPFRQASDQVFQPQQLQFDFSPPKAAQSLEAKPNFWKIYGIDPKGPRVYDEVADVLIQVGSPWMDGSIIESQAPLLGLEKGKLRQAMNRAHRRADRGGGKMFMPAGDAYKKVPIDLQDEYINFRKNLRSDLEVSRFTNDGQILSAPFWLKSAINQIDATELMEVTRKLGSERIVNNDLTVDQLASIALKYPNIKSKSFAEYLARRVVRGLDIASIEMAKVISRQDAKMGTLLNRWIDYTTWEINHPITNDPIDFYDADLYEVIHQSLKEEGQYKKQESFGEIKQRQNSDPSKLFMPAAYHGTPHTFKAEEGAPLGKFKTSQIGTGEGAQAYGHGLYFAGRKEVAEFYREQLAPTITKDFKVGTMNIFKDEVPMDYSPDKLERVYGKEATARASLIEDLMIDEGTIRRAFIEDGEKGAKREVKKVIESFLDIYEGEADYIKVGKKALDMPVKFDTTEYGSLYKVELAPKENEYLLWDKPLSEQPKGVREKVRKVLEDDPNFHQPSIDRFMEVNTGGEFYNSRTALSQPAPRVSKALKEAGIPGIKYLDGSSRGKGEGDYNYVIFDEADVTITEKLFMPASDDKLTATHNLSAEALAKADELGGLPVPSVGITKGRALEGFGEVTLLGTRPLVDPELGVPAFGSDVYSKRFPREKYKPVKIKKADSFIAKYKPFESETGGHELSLIFDALVNSPDLSDAKHRFVTSELAKIAFLKSKGKTIRVPKTRQPVDGIIDKQLVDEVNSLKNTPRIPSDPEYKLYSDYLRKAFDRREKKFAEFETNKERSQRLREKELNNLFDGNGLVRMGVGDRLLYDIGRFDNLVVDKSKLRDRLEKKFTKKLKAEYEQWATQEIASLFDNPYILLDGKKVPLTLETATDSMKGRIKAVEKNLTFGPGEARSVASPRISSIQEMRNRSDSIVPKDEFETYKETIQEPVHKEFRDAAYDAFDYESAWMAFDNAYAALASYFRSSRGTQSQRMKSSLRQFGFKPNEVLVEKAIKAAEVLRDAPTEYFEAKPQRAVMLKEFVGAVIPKKASPKVKELADKYGWEVKTYDPNKPETRQTAVKQLANRLQKQGKEVLFMPSDPKAPKRQPVNRVQQQARSMPANRFMAPASMAKGELSERFR